VVTTHGGDNILINNIKLFDCFIHQEVGHLFLENRSEQNFLRSLLLFFFFFPFVSSRPDMTEIIAVPSRRAPAGAVKMQLSIAARGTTILLLYKSKIKKTNNKKKKKKSKKKKKTNKCVKKIL